MEARAFYRVINNISSSEQQPQNKMKVFMLCDDCDCQYRGLFFCTKKRQMSPFLFHEMT